MVKHFVLGISFLMVASAANAQQAKPVEDTKQYEKWYHEVEECLGMKGDFYGVTFYVDSTGRHPVTHVRFNGYHEEGSIVLFYKKANDEMTVKHEIIHDITKSRSNEHRRIYFINKCGDYSLGEVVDG